MKTVTLYFYNHEPFTVAVLGNTLYLAITDPTIKYITDGETGEIIFDRTEQNAG